jgi:hypothetical protein
MPTGPLPRSGASAALEAYFSDGATFSSSLGRELVTGKDGIRLQVMRLPIFAG